MDGRRIREYIHRIYGGMIEDDMSVNKQLQLQQQQRLPVNNYEAKIQ